MAFRSPNSSSSSAKRFTMRRNTRSTRPRTPDTPVPFRSAYPEQLFDLQNTLNVTEVDNNCELALTSTRTCTMKEYDKEISDLRKDNFSLKLQIYLLNRKLVDKYPSNDKVSSNKSADVLSVEIEALKSQIIHEHELLLKAHEALENQQRKYIKEMHQLKVSHQEQSLEQEKKIKELEDLMAVVEKRSVTANESDSRHSNNEWYKQAFSLADFTSEGENFDGCEEDDHKLSLGELMEIIESQRVTIKNLTAIQESNMTEIEKYKVRRIQLEKVVKRLCAELAYKRELGYNLSIDQADSRRLRIEDTAEDDSSQINTEILSPQQNNANCLDVEAYSFDESKFEGLSSSVDGECFKGSSADVTGLLYEEGQKFHILLTEKIKEIDHITQQLQVKHDEFNKKEKELNDTLLKLFLAQEESRNFSDKVSKLDAELKERDDLIINFKNCFNKISIIGDADICEPNSTLQDGKSPHVLQDLNKLENMMNRLTALWNVKDDKSMWAGLRGLDLIQESQAKEEASVLLTSNLKLRKEVDDLQMRLKDSQTTNSQLLNEISADRNHIKLLKEAPTEFKNEIAKLNHQLDASRTLNSILQEQVNLAAQTVDSRNDKGIVKFENELERLKLEVKNLQIGLNDTKASEKSHKITSDYACSELVGMLKQSQTEVNRLKFVLDSTEGTVKTLSGKVQFYKRLLDEANLLPNKSCESAPILGQPKGFSISAPCTPSKEDLSPRILNLRLDVVNASCQTSPSKLLECSLDSETDCNQTKIIFKTRLEELAEFLEKLLHFDENGDLDLSCLTPENIERFKNCIESSLNASSLLSNSLSAWENSTALGDFQSPVMEKFSGTRYANSTRITSVNSPRRRLFKNHVASAVKKCSPISNFRSLNDDEQYSVNADNRFGKVALHYEKSASESEVYSEPDLNISKQRIGLSDSNVPPPDHASTTESEIDSENVYDSSRNLSGNLTTSAPRSGFKLSPRYNKNLDDSSSHMKRLEECLSENFVLKQQLQQSSKNYNKLLEQFEQRLAANSSSAELYDKYKDTVQQQQNLIKQMKYELQGKDAIICDMENERDSLIKEMNELAEKFESYSETIESLQKMLHNEEKLSKDSSRKVEFVENALKNKQFELEEAIINKEKTQLSLNSFTRLLKDNDDLIKNLKKTNSTLENENKKDMLSKEAIIAELTKVNQELEANNEQCLKSQMEQQIVAQKQLEDLNYKILIKEREIAEINDKLISNQTLLNELKQVGEKTNLHLPRIQHELGEARSSKEALQNLMETNEKSHAQTVEILTQNVNDLHIQLNETEKRNADLQRQLEMSKANSPLRLTIGNLDDCSSSIDSPESASSFAYLSLTGEQFGTANNNLPVNKSSDEGFDKNSLRTYQLQSSDSVRCPTYSSPDLGIESDQSKFSSLERPHQNHSEVISEIRKRSDYLAPGFPADTDWNVVNSAPAKSQKFCASFNLSSVMKKPLNYTHIGEQFYDTSGSQSKGESDSYISDSNSQASPSKLKLLRKGNNEAFKVLKEIRRIVRCRLTFIKGVNKEELAVDLEPWRNIYGCTDELKDCMLANDYLLTHICKFNNKSSVQSHEVLPIIGCAKSEEEWNMVQIQLAMERGKADEAIKSKNEFIDNYKKKMEKAISKQLHLTYNVMNQAGKNLEKRAKNDRIRVPYKERKSDNTIPCITPSVSSHGHGKS